MPKRSDIRSVLVIGSGPIVIGQACEFDYSGTQACRVLREEGVRVILVNSNPATIMTDPEFADATYVEPITPEVVEAIIAEERPDAVLATLGGQTALNCAMELHERGILEKYGCRSSAPTSRRSSSARTARSSRAWSNAAAPSRPAPSSATRWTRSSPRPTTSATRSSCALVHHGRPRLGLRVHPGRAAPDRGRRPAVLAGHRGAPRGVDPGVEGVRARGDARPRRQRRRRVLDREPRPDGRAHRRLDHRRAGPHPHRPGVPAAAGHLHRRHP